MLVLLLLDRCWRIVLATTGGDLPPNIMDGRGGAVLLASVIACLWPIAEVQCAVSRNADSGATLFDISSSSSVSYLSDSGGVGVDGFASGLGGYPDNCPMGCVCKGLTKVTRIYCQLAGLTSVPSSGHLHAKKL